MRNVIVMGSGRSGTSMVAGTLAKSDYFMGENLYPARESNPKGFFEDSEVNEINETLIAQVVPNRPQIVPRLLRNILFSKIPEKKQRWLARVPLNASFSISPSMEKKIRKLTQRTPYCFKDPRFSYTLPAWRPFLVNAVFICVFRDPNITIKSILNESLKAKHLKNLYINSEMAQQVWTLMYKHIIDFYCYSGQWLFIHYNQMFESSGLDRIAEFTGAQVDYSFPDRKLARSEGIKDCTDEIWNYYKQLCELADYDI